MSPNSGLYRDEPAPSAREAGRFLVVHGTYIVAETAEGILIVDQHALHEKVLFTRLLAQLEAGEIPRQGLLVPAVFAASPVEMARAEELRNDLVRAGFDCEPAGPARLAVRSVPALAVRGDPEEIVRAVLAEGSAGAAGAVHRVLATAACRAAVKAGDHLEEEEIASLLADRAAVHGSVACPHGRPTALVITVADLEKGFLRR